MLVVPEISCTLLEMKFYYRLPRWFNFHYLSLELGCHFEICKLGFNSNLNNNSIITKWVFYT